MEAILYGFIPGLAGLLGIFLIVIVIVQAFPNR
jgi:hypothetical protein